MAPGQQVLYVNVRPGTRELLGRHVAPARVATHLFNYPDTAARIRHLKSSSLGGRAGGAHLPHTAPFLIATATLTTSPMHGSMVSHSSHTTQDETMYISQV